MKIEDYAKLTVEEQQMRKKEILKCLDKKLEQMDSYKLKYKLPEMLNGLVLNGEIFVKIIFAIIEAKESDMCED